MRHPLLNAITGADYAEILAQRCGFKLVFDAKVKTAFTFIQPSGQTLLVVPAFNHTTTDDQILFIIYMILHEIAHHEHGANTFAIIKRESLDMQSRVGHVFNMVEDCRIENAGSTKYRGDRRDMAAGLRVFLARRAQDKGAVTEPLFTAVQLMCIMGRFFFGNEHTPHMNVMIRTEKCETELKRVLKDFGDRLRKLPLVNMEGTEASWTLALDIVKKYWPAEAEPKQYQLPAKPEKGKGDEKGGELGDGEGDAGDDAEGGAGDGDGDAKAQAERELSEKKEDDDPKPGALSPNLVISDHAKQQKQKKNSSDSSGTHCVNSGTGEWTYNPACINDERYEETTRVEHHLPPNVNVRPYGNRLRTLLQSESYPRTKRGIEAGRRLSGPFLHRAMLPDHIPQHSHIWQTKVAGKNPALDTCVTLLVDMSRSMNQVFPGKMQFFHVAIRITGALDYAMRDLLHMPVRVVCFSESAATYHIREVKGFNEHIKRGVLEERMAEFYRALGGSTPTGVAMLNCIKWMMKRKETRKLMLVITDGEPFGRGSIINGCGDQMAAAEEVGRMCRKLPDLGMYGICLAADDYAIKTRGPLWERVFGDQHCVVKTADDAIVETFKGLTRLLMRRKR